MCLVNSIYVCASREFDELVGLLTFFLCQMIDIMMSIATLEVKLCDRLNMMMLMVMAFFEYCDARGEILGPSQD